MTIVIPRCFVEFEVTLAEFFIGAKGFEVPQETIFELSEGKNRSREAVDHACTCSANVIKK